MVDFGAAAAVPGGIPAPFGQLAAAVLAGDGPAAVRLARQAGALVPGRELDPRLVVELLHPVVATAAAGTFTYSRPWLRGLMAHFTDPRLAPALRNLTPPREYALVWRATLSAAGLYSRRDRPHPRVPPGVFSRVPRRHPARLWPVRRQAAAEDKPPGMRYAGAPPEAAQGGRVMARQQRRSVLVPAQASQHVEWVQPYPSCLAN